VYLKHASSAAAIHPLIGSVSLELVPLTVDAVSVSQGLTLTLQAEIAVTGASEARRFALRRQLLRVRAAYKRLAREEEELHRVGEEVHSATCLIINHATPCHAMPNHTTHHHGTSCTPCRRMLFTKKGVHAAASMRAAVRSPQ
jgi:hypothetical protein